MFVNDGIQTNTDSQKPQTLFCATLTGKRTRRSTNDKEKMSGITRQNSTTTSEDKKLQLALAKAELLALKRELHLKDEMKKEKKDDQDFATKHSAIIKYIKLKHIAIQWINNTYDKISMKQEKLLKDHAREQCISSNLTPDPFLIQNPDKEFNFLWKPDFVIYANGDWFPYDEPITPPTSPKENNKGKVFSFGDSIEVAEGDAVLQVKKGIPMSQFDGPLLTKEKAFADLIELWFGLKYTTGRKVYTEFWKEEKIKLFKKMGFFKDFGTMMEESLEQYGNGEKVSFISSKSPFNMDATLKKHMKIILNQYKKHRSQGLNVHAKPFIPSFQ